MNSLNPDNTKTIRLLASNPCDLDQASDFLRRGGIVAMPTETVYGLAAHGFSAEAIARVFRAKDRPLNNPLILHTNSAERAFEFFDFSNNELAQKRFFKLADAFWPGPLTVIAKKTRHVPALATGNLPSVAVRIPDNRATNAVMANLDFPLVMPSANLSTRPSPTTAEHVLNTLNGRIDAVIDDGVCIVGIESTVIHIEPEEVKILRPGIITSHQLESCLQEPVRYANGHAEQPLSPGQSFLHYSPKVSSVACFNVESIVPWSEDTIILARACDYAQLAKKQGARKSAAVTILLSDDPSEFAKELYDALYRCELRPEKNLAIIVPREQGELWRAILDRLLRTKR